MRKPPNIANFALAGSAMIQPVAEAAEARRLAAERRHIEAGEADMAAGNALSDDAARDWLRAWAAAEPLPEDAAPPARPRLREG
jgi:gluconate kinase